MQQIVYTELQSKVDVKGFSCSFPLLLSHVSHVCRAGPERRASSRPGHRDEIETVASAKIGIETKNERTR